MNILITGGSSGLGKELVLEYLKSGSNVLTVARTRAKLLELEKHVLSYGYPGKLFTYECDITDEKSAIKALEVCTKSMKGLDILILNAGISIKDDAVLSYQNYKRTFEVNLLSVVKWTEVFLPELGKSQCSQVVTISSVGDSYAVQGSNGYGPSKAALSLYSEALRADLYSKGSKISVTNIRPGFITTKMVSKNEISLLSVSAEAAAKRIINAVHKKKTTYSFPLIMVILGLIFKLAPKKVLVKITDKLIK